MKHDRHSERGKRGEIAACLVLACMLGPGSSGRELPLGTGTAQAQPSSRRVQLTVSLSGAAVPGSEGLGYFLPELARTLAEALERGGLSVVPPGAPVSAADPPTAILVVLEELPGDRVTLSARAKGRRADVDGPVEGLDSQADELAARLLAICLDAPVPTPLPHTPGAKLPRGKEPALVSVTPVVKEPKGLGEAKPPRAPAVPTSTPPSTTLPVAPTPPSSAPATTPPAATPAATPAVTPPPATTPTPPTTPPATPTPAVTPAPGKPSEVADPYGPDARVSDVAPTPVADRAAGYVRGRVVVHTIADPPGAEPGTGSVATQALYAVIQRRLRLSIVPMGTGIAALPVAAEEGLRAQSRAVVMARIDSYALYATQDGLIARMRFELSVVREGRLVMRRLLNAETPPGASTAAAAEGRRGRQIDPVYLAVSHAIETQLGDLALALNPQGATP